MEGEEETTGVNANLDLLSVTQLGLHRHVVIELESIHQTKAVVQALMGRNRQMRSRVDSMRSLRCSCCCC